MNNEVTTYNVLIKIKSFLITLFFVLSVLLFSSVSVLSKLILLSILFIIFLASFFLNIINLESLLKKEIYIFFLLIIYLAFNTFLVSKVRFESKVELVNYMFYFFSFLIFFFLASSDKNKLTKDIMWGILFVEVFIFIFYIFYKEVAIYFFVYNPNILSGWCLISWLFNFFILKKYKIYKLSFISLLLASILIFLSKSFSAIFIIVSFLLFFYLKKYPLVILSVLILLISFGVVSNFDSFLDRIVWNIIGVRVFFNNFLSGVGLGNFKFLYQMQNLNLPLLPQTATTFVHNYFLHMSAEGGIIWLFLFLSFIYLVFKNGIRIKEWEFFVPLVGILFQNIVDYNLIIPQNSLIFYIFCSAICGEKNNLTNKKKQSIVSFCIFFLIFIFFVLYILKMQKVLVLLDNETTADLKKVTAIDETCWYAYKKLALSYFNKRDLKDAETNFLNVIKNNPFDSESYLYLAIIYKHFKQSNIAYYFLNQAIKMAPKKSMEYIKYFNTSKLL